MSREGEEGYALVAAVASIAVFATMALAVLDTARMGLADAGAEQAQMQAVAAADAGIAFGLSKILGNDPTQRWAADGAVHALRFGEAELRIVVRDERGKVPLGLLDEPQATRLLEQAGLEGERLLIARDSLLDWIDDDEIKRPFGAEDPYYSAAGIRPPGARLASIDELALVRGLDPVIVARIRPYVTTYTLRSGFDAQYADPRALAVMEAGGDGPQAIERARALGGQRTALAFASTPSLVDRPVSIEVLATLPGGGRAARTLVAEITGISERPYVVRAYE
ncbi:MULTISPECIES: type II secretion system protein GspK [unclassified Sphingomonas]|uniref:general secretion pathway protein GspK n=3 Tax=Bacteria TaxID=2 RepID=UPI000A5DCA8E|nr:MULTISPECIES: type II secretion system protein GspK [unclassified Sphingomonas]